MTDMQPQRRVYGRRKARPLRQARAALLETLLPQLTISPVQGEFLTINVPTWLEIGFGAGEHLAGIAQRLPHHTFIGCEPFLSGVTTLLKTINAQNIHNIRLVVDDARNLTQSIPDRALEGAYVLFSDPWPKKRHHKRRLLQTDFLAELIRIIKVGGSLTIATDHAGYQEWLLERLPQFQDCLKLCHDPLDQRPEGWIVTRYEEKALREGRTPFYWVFETR